MIMKTYFTGRMMYVDVCGFTVVPQVIYVICKSCPDSKCRRPPKARLDSEVLKIQVQYMGVSIVMGDPTTMHGLQGKIPHG